MKDYFTKHQLPRDIDIVRVDDPNERYGRLLGRDELIITGRGIGELDPDIENYNIDLDSIPRNLDIERVDDPNERYGPLLVRDELIITGRGIGELDPDIENYIIDLEFKSKNSEISSTEEYGQSKNWLGLKVAKVNEKIKVLKRKKL